MPRARTPAKKASSKKKKKKKSVTPARKRSPSRASLSIFPKIYPKISSKKSGHEQSSKGGGIEIHFNIVGVVCFAVTMALTLALDTCKRGITVPGMVSSRCTYPADFVVGLAGPLLPEKYRVAVVVALWLLNAYFVLPVVEALFRFALLSAGYKSFRKESKKISKKISTWLTKMLYVSVWVLGAAVLIAAFVPKEFGIICDAVGNTLGNWKTDLDIDFGVLLGDDSWGAASGGDTGSSWFSWLSSFEWIQWISNLAKQGADVTGSTSRTLNLSPSKALLSAIPLHDVFITGAVEKVLTAALDEGLPLAMGTLLLVAGDRALPYVVMLCGFLVALLTAGNIVPFGMAIGYNIARVQGPHPAHWIGALYGFLMLWITYGQTGWAIVSTKSSGEQKVEPISPLNVKGASITFSGEKNKTQQSFEDCLYVYMWTTNIVVLLFFLLFFLLLLSFPVASLGRDRNLARWNRGGDDFWRTFL